MPGTKFAVVVSMSTELDMIAETVLTMFDAIVNVAYFAALDSEVS